MKKHKKTIYYVHGFRASKRTFRPGFPSFLLVVMLFGSIGYGIWANVIPSPQVVIRSGSEKIAANILKEDAPQSDEQKLNNSKDIKKPQKIKRKNKELNQQLVIKAKSYSDTKWSVYVEDIDSGLTASINEKDDYSLGSVSRLVALPALESKVSPDRWNNNLYGSSVKDCVNKGLGQNNDPCYEKLLKYLSKDYINKTTKSYGYDIEVDDKFNAKTSPDKLASYISDVKRGQSLFAKTRRAVFDALYTPKQTAGINLGCGDCRVANKQSYENKIAVDAGIVTHGPRSYVVVIVAENGNFDQITDMAQTIDRYMQP